MTVQHRKTLKNIGFHIATYLFTSWVIYLIVQRVGISAIFSELKQADFTLVFCSFLLSLLFAILSGLKLKLFVLIMGYKIGLIRCQMITFATFPLNIILPSKSGDFAKIWSLNEILPISQGFGIMLLDRLVDLTVLCLMSITGSVIIKDIELFIISLSMFLFGTLAIVFLNKTSRFNHTKKMFIIIQEVGYATKCLLRSPFFLFLIATASAVIWLGSTLQIYLLYSSVGQHVPITFCVAAVPIAILVGMLPLTIAGMGTRDLAIIKLFSDYSPTSASISISMLFLLLRYWILALIGIPFIPTLKPRKSGDISFSNIDSNKSNR